MASQANVRSVDNAIEAANNSYARKTVSTKGKNDVSKYNIENFSYPKDLMDPAGIYGGNYVVFYINIPVDSKLGRSTSTETVADYTPGERGYTVGANMTQGDIRGGQAALSVGGAVLGKTLGVGGAGAVAAAGAVAGTEVTIRNAATTNRGQKRLKTAIALHIPNQLAARYGVQWAEEDTFAFSAAVAGADQLVKAVQGKGNMKEAKGVAADVITNLTLSKAPGAAAMSAATGLASNPKRDQIFKSVDFRNFTFEYQFFPRNEPEAKNILNIIQQFKYHMHPEYKDSNSFLYIYPSEFDIVYYTGGKENETIHRHTSCVLTEMSVNYTPNGNFATFPNGMPTQINVQMSFKELALLSKELIDEGM